MSERIIDTIKRVDIDSCLDAFDTYAFDVKPIFVKLQRMKLSFTEDSINPEYTYDAKTLQEAKSLHLYHINQVLSSIDACRERIKGLYDSLEKHIEKFPVNSLEDQTDGKI